MERMSKFDVKSLTADDLLTINEIFSKFINEIEDMRYCSVYSTIGNSNAELEIIQKFIREFSYEKLRMMLELNGFSFPEDEMEFYKTLIRISRMKNVAVKPALSMVLRIMLIRKIDVNPDKELIRLFRKSQLSHMIKFLDKYDIIKK